MDMSQIYIEILWGFLSLYTCQTLVLGDVRFFGLLLILEVQKSGISFFFLFSPLEILKVLLTFANFFELPQSPSSFSTDYEDGPF